MIVITTGTSKWVIGEKEMTDEQRKALEALDKIQNSLIKKEYLICWQTEIDTIRTALRDAGKVEGLINALKRVVVNSHTEGSVIESIAKEALSAFRAEREGVNG